MGTCSHPLGRLWWQSGHLQPPIWESVVAEWAPHPLGILWWQNGHPTYLGVFGGRMGTYSHPLGRLWWQNGVQPPPTWEALVVEWAPAATHLGGFGGRMGTDSICSPTQNHSPTQNQPRPRPSQDTLKPSQATANPIQRQTKPKPTQALGKPNQAKPPTNIQPFHNRQQMQKTKTTSKIAL